MAREIAQASSDPGRRFGRPIRLDPPAGAQLERLTMPLLAIAGELDVSDVAAVAHHLEERVTTARALIMPGVAHMIGLETPQELGREIVELLAPIDRWL